MATPSRSALVAPAPAPPFPFSPAGRSASWPAAVGWIVLVGGAFAWGLLLTPAADRPFTRPLVGTFDVRFGLRLLPAAVLAALTVWAGHRLAARMPWGRLCLLAAGVAALWAVALAASDGWGALTAPLEAGQEYLVDVPLVHGPDAFLRGFAHDVATHTGYSVHVEGHPPGFLLLLWGLDRIGLGGSGPAAALVIAGGAAAVPAALVAAREMAGEAWARRAAPFMALAPFALWVATSADALFAGVAAWGAALVVLATGREARRSDALAAGGGLLLGAAVFLTYGAILVALIPLAVGVARRRARPLLVAALGVIAVTAAFAAAGFWWPDGLAATRARYAVGISAHRPYGYFLVANLAAFAVALGPAAAAGLGANVRRPVERTGWLLPAAALTAVAIADLSGLSKGEAERIWLPFAPWALLAAGAIRGPSARWWLATSAGSAILIQGVLRSLW